MDARELLAAYPTIQHAVSFVELFCRANSFDPQDCVAEAITGKMRPETFIQFCKEFCDDEIELEPSEVMRVSRAEMDRPEFLTYINGLYGAC